MMLTDGGRRYLRKVKFPPVKSLLGKLPATRGPQKTKRNQKQYLSSRGEAARSALAFLSLPYSTEEFKKDLYKACTLLALASNHRLVGDARKYDLPLYLPRVYGGLGFPHPSGKGLKHVRPFFMKGLASLLSDNRNISYILNFRTLSGIWEHNPSNPAAVEAQRLYDSWVGSVFRPHRKAVMPEEFNQTYRDRDLCWADCFDLFERINGRNLEMQDWDGYDSVKDWIFERTGVKWFPIKEVLDSVEAHFRNDVLFDHQPLAGEIRQASLNNVSRRVHCFYEDLLVNQPPPPGWKHYSDYDISELQNIIHWRQNSVLVAGHLPLLENFKSRW
jgi:hypothetical protein